MGGKIKNELSRLANGVEIVSGLWFISLLRLDLRFFILMNLFSPFLKAGEGREDQNRHVGGLEDPLGNNDNNNTRNNDDGDEGDGVNRNRPDPPSGKSPSPVLGRNLCAEGHEEVRSTSAPVVSIQQSLYSF